MKSTFDISKWFIENNPFLNCYQKGYKDNHLKLQKLLYYSNVLMELLYGKKLLKENIVAYKEGFVVEEFYNQYRSDEESIYNRDNIDNFTDTEKEVLNLTNVLFGYMTGEELSAAVHLDDIWEKYNQEAQVYKSKKILEEKDIIDYYGQQEIFNENIGYARENLDAEVNKIKRIKARKSNVDDIYIYYDKNLFIDEEIKDLINQIKIENSLEKGVQYLYISKESDGSLYVE